MKIEYVRVFGFQPALRGMRNSHDSWENSDSEFWSYPYVEELVAPEDPVIGPNDLKLACNLVKAGPSHRKFLRQVMIWADLTLPRYIYQEFDTYKVGTVRNSQSSWHTAHKGVLTKDDFESGKINSGTLEELNSLRKRYAKYKDKKYLIAYKRKLPEGFLQKSTYTLSYETALNIYFQRRNHIFPEWQTICEWIATLPYMKEFIEAAEGNKNG